MAKTERPAEVQFTLPDRWQRRLFTALARRYGIEPYRYKRQRYTTVMLRNAAGDKAVTMSWDVVAADTDADVPLNVTVFWPGVELKPAPEMVTVAPGMP